MTTNYRRRANRWWLGAWRIAGMALLVAFVVGLGRQAFAGPDPVRQDPASLLECDSPYHVTARPLHAADPAAGAASQDSPAQLAEQWLFSDGTGLRAAASAGPRTLFQSDQRIDVAFATARGTTTAVVSLVDHHEIGWIVEASYACA